jgi:hypothetical protein
LPLLPNTDGLTVLTQMQYYSRIRRFCLQNPVRCSKQVDFGTN